MPICKKVTSIRPYFDFAKHLDSIGFDRFTSVVICAGISGRTESRNDPIRAKRINVI